MITIYLRQVEEASTDALVKELAKGYFAGGVPEILRQERGKPYFAGDPGIHFSVSHSCDLVAVAFGPVEMGIDLQQHRIRPYESRADAMLRYARLAQRYFHPREQAHLETQPWEAFFRVWTAKESFVKRTGRGIDGNFAKLCILPQGDAWQDENGFFRQTALPGEYTLTLCTEAPTDWTIK